MAGNNIQTVCSSCGSIYKVPETLVGKTVSCKKCKSKFVISNGSNNKTSEIPIIGKLAVQYKFLSNKDLSKIISAFQKSDSGNTENDLVKFLLKKGLVSKENMNILMGARNALETRQLDKKFALIALENGFSDQTTINKAIKKQTAQFQKNGDCNTLGDILVQEGALSEKQKNLILSKQNRNISDPVGSNQANHNVSEDDVNSFLRSISSLPFSITVEDVLKVFKKENMPLSLGEILKKEGIATTPVKKEPAVKVESKPKVKDEGSKSEENKNAPSDKEVNENSEGSINVDAGAIDENIIEEQAEKKTENPPTIIESDFMNIIISPDNVEAKVLFKKNPPTKMTVDTLKDLLVQNGITYGHVDDSLIYMHLHDEEALGKEFLIAEGVAPQYGKNGKVTYHFDTDPVKVGALDESGHIDFKDRGDIPHINAGDLLAEIVPAKKGVHGIDVYSNPILVPEIPELKLKCESGVNMSHDGKQAFASVDGQPLLIGGRRLLVLQELNINGDVGYKTGHVEFDGNVNITGTIQSGFKVKGANITALEILGAEIEASGNIQVIAGISGAKINSKGDIKAKYINKSEVLASGDIIIEKEIIDSKVENSGATLLPRGKIISSSVSSRKGIECKDIGTEMSSPCVIRIGGDDKLKKDVAEIDKKIKDKNVELGALRKIVEEIQAKEQNTHVVIAELAHIQDRSQIGIREIEDLENSGQASNEHKAGIEELKAKVKEADERINKCFDEQEMYLGMIEEQNEKMNAVLDEIENLKADKKELIDKAKKYRKTVFAKVSGVLYAGAHVKGTYSNVVVRETIRRIKIYEAQTKDPMAATAYEIKQMKL